MRRQRSIPEGQHEKKGKNIRAYNSPQQGIGEASATVTTYPLAGLSPAEYNLSMFTACSGQKLNEPIRRIKLFSSRLLHLRELPMPAKYRDCLDRVYDNAETMQRMVNDLVALSKLDNPENQRRKVNLSVALDGVLKDLSGMIREASAEITCSQLGDIVANADQIGLLFFHLVENAVKFRRSGIKPCVEIHADTVSGISPNAALKRKRFRRIVIRDNGIGFDQKYACRIFEVFYRLHAAEMYPGTGIGLSICKKIAENHGGFIRVTSHPLGGTEFQVYLPMSRLNG
jgi:signal transduction histidine kinase